jgi:hypothetical protein
MTLLQLLRANSRITLELLPDREHVQVTTDAGVVDLQIEDVEFNTGGALTMVHEVQKDSGWKFDEVTCEACQ